MSLPKQKYLNNRDLLKEINKSKNTYCTYTDKAYADYDIILSSLDRINIRTIAEAKRNRAARLARADWERAVIAANKKLSQKDFEIDYRKMQKEDLVFRIMTFDHVPKA